MNKKLIAVIAAGLLAILGVGAVVLYAQGAEDRAFDQASLVPVLVVTKPVPEGAQAEKLAASVELRELPKVAIVDGAVTDLSDLGDTVANAPMAAGEQVTTTRFAQDGDEKKDETDLQPGQQQMEVGLATPRVPSTVRAGSTIGVVASFATTDGTGGITRLITSKVKVISITNGNVVQDTGATEGRILRLAVSADQAQRLANAMEFGKVWVTDQNEQTDVRGVPSIDSKGVVK